MFFGLVFCFDVFLFYEGVWYWYDVLGYYVVWVFVGLDDFVVWVVVDLDVVLEFVLVVGCDVEFVLSVGVEICD